MEALTNLVSFLMESGVILLMGILAILGGVAKILDEIKGGIGEDHILYTVIDVIQKILDFLTANNKHK